ncbi:hypothetical protein EAI52_27505 [Escherichia coli]|nr:hypothetical protein EAI52_27505 [Escherichia coli]
MTSLKTSIKTITYLSDTGCLEIQGASLLVHSSTLFDRYTHICIYALLTHFFCLPVIFCQIHVRRSW